LSTDFLVVLTTTAEKTDAETIARALVERKLAGCVQVLGPIGSTYRWQGKVESAEEWLCLIKTRSGLFETVEGTIRELHPYEVPEIVALPIVQGSRSYLDWLSKSVVD
jgi:periplasmic divalent cation tolerance protein